IIDEAHHLLPAAGDPAPMSLPLLLDRVLLVTVHPDQVAPAVLGAVGAVLVKGPAPGETLDRFCRAVGERPALFSPPGLQSGEVCFWRRGPMNVPFRVRVAPAKSEQRRHLRKYAEGELPPERSFYFRGPQKKMNLRAQNLFLFLQMAEGVDE